MICFSLPSSKLSLWLLFYLLAYGGFRPCTLGSTVGSTSFDDSDSDFVSIEITTSFITSKMLDPGYFTLHRKITRLRQSQRWVPTVFSGIINTKSQVLMDFIVPETINRNPVKCRIILLNNFTLQFLILIFYCMKNVQMKDF